MRIFVFKIILTLITGTIVLGIYFNSIPEETTIQRIKRKGAITLLTSYGRTTYYIYRESEMGFEYELSKAFADYLGVDLNLIVADWEDILPLLNDNRGDYVGSRVVITPGRKEFVSFSRPYLSMDEHVITHKNKKLKKLEKLDGQTVTVRNFSSYEERLKTMQSDNLSFQIKLVDETPETLIELASKDKSMITIADLQLARRLLPFYPNFRIRFPIAQNQPVGWVVKKGNDALINEMNAFLLRAKGSGLIDRLKEKYFDLPDTCDCFDAYKFHRRLKTRLPKYMKQIQDESQKYGFDWRKVAAVIYQESHFDKNAHSYTGVRGLMQLTQATAKRMGVTDRLDPSQSIKGGVKYLHLLYQRYDEIDPFNRMNFALAAYNVGPGHVDDAMKIAALKGLPPKEWQSIKEVLPLLGRRKYYKQTKYGYARGWEAVSYVQNVNRYYDILQMYEINANMESMMSSDIY